MNSLTKVLLEDILEAEKKKVTAIYGGGFKPPTKGHFNVVEKATEQNPEIDDFIVFVGGGERDGITQGESIQVWELYKKYLPLKVRIEPAKAPIGDILKYAKEHPDEEVLWVIGARENNPEDFADIASRTRTIDKYPNLQLRVIQTAGGVSGTAARKAIKDNNKEQFFHLIPDIEEKEQVWDIVSPVIKENFMGDIKNKFKKFISAVKQESKETKEAVSLLIKAAKGEIKLSDTDKNNIGEQLKDVLKLVGLTAIATLPGGFIAGALIKLFKAESLVTPSSFVNEVGEANLKPYKWEEVDVEGYWVYTRFITDSETQYDVDIKSTVYFPPGQMDSRPALEIEFSAKPKGAEGSSTKIVVNKGEMYRVMSTIVNIIKKYIKKSRAEAIIYSPSKKSSEENFGTQRDNLYRAFISKAFPGTTFKQSGDYITAILPNMNEGTCGYDTDVATGKKLDTPGGLEEGRPKKKDPKKGTGKKPEGSGRRLYTDEDPKDTVRIKFKTKEDIVDTLNKKQFKAKSHARQSQVINLIHQRVRAAYGKAKDPEVRSRLKRALDYIEGRKEASKKKTERLRKMKEASDPQAGTALPYGSGFAPVKELVTATEVICDNCGWEWDKKDGGDDLYICHKCGHDNTPKSLNENTIPTIDIIEKCAQLSNHMVEKGYNIKPFPTIEFIDDDVENAEDFLGKTAYYDPNEKKIVVYTAGRHPKDIVRSFAHEMIHHMQNLEGRLGDITTTDTTEDDHLNDIEAEANLKGTMSFRNWTDSLKENKDPFGLLEGLLNEGVYDSLVTRLSKDVINAWKSQFDENPKRLFSLLDKNYEEEDAKGRPMEFDLLAKLDFKKTKDRNYKVDGGANEGDDETEGFVALNFTVDPRELPRMWSTIAMDIRDVLRHELEHLTQGGWNVRADKEMEDDQAIRDLIQKYKILAPKNYFMLDKEVDAMLQGMYYKAKKSRKPFADVIDDYLDMVGLEPEEKEEIKTRWRGRLKALSLPQFESKYKLGKVLKEEETDQQYKIYCDMDGVLVDFDKGYKALTGVETHHADAQGKNEFWNLFRTSLENKKMQEKDYWANLQWMPDGKELWDHIKQYKPTLLSAPSRDPQSRWGKRIWVKKNIPGTPLILAAAEAKKNYARKNAILIDDRVSNINDWNAAGGIGILHTSTASTLEKLAKYGL